MNCLMDKSRSGTFPVGLEPNFTMPALNEYQDIRVNRIPTKKEIPSNEKKAVLQVSRSGVWL